MNPDYGIDAPGVRRGMLAAGLGGLITAGLAAATASRTDGPTSAVAGVMAGIAALVAVYGLGMGTYMTFSSRVGKLRTRDRLLDLAQGLTPWTGRERVLDVGCGRGLMLIGAAKRLTTGQAVGIDLWRTEDQADNSPAAALDNAKLEGVAERVKIETGDARSLPFADREFDWVVHNLPTETDREQALQEMLRVLKPNGCLVLADIAHHNSYLKLLSEAGLGNVEEQKGGLGSCIMGLLSGGTFRPQALVGKKAA